MAGGLQGFEYLQAAEKPDWTPLLTGIVVSGVSAFVCIHYFLVFVRRIGMQPFVGYRIALGMVLIVLFGGVGE